MWKVRIAVASALAATTGALAQGCGDYSPSTERAISTSQAYDVATDLISPSSCVTKNGRLVNCAIRARTLNGQDLDTAVPLRTVLKTRKTGNCSTQFSLEVTLETAGESAIRFPYLQFAQAVARRRDGLPITQLSLTDSSPWTGKVSLDQSCAIGLEIVSNEPDVNSKAEAEAIIARIEDDIASKSKIRDGLLYNEGFAFMRAVAENYHSQLTNETIMQLRAAAAGAINTISNVTTACGTSGPGGTPAYPMSAQDQANILVLYMGLPQLGSADDWTLPDGSTKTLADSIGPHEREVLDTITRLANSGPDGGVNQEAEYQAANVAVEQAKAKLTLARAQLAIWLAS